MAKMIDYGIDLGTTNSLIAKFKQGRVEVFKNPRGHKENLPSAVAFRKDKILIGDKAREYVNKAPNDVASRFKRKMGTTETIRIGSQGSSKTPEELSALILKELKGFVHSGEKIESAVITIPASFDTIQSNATKEAGTQAGINEVVLLQEPIAASLAYANYDGSEDLKNSQWIVYDLGGGTFDVALVKIVEGELTVVDHAGDNYFGGVDLDALIVEKLVVPALEAQGEYENLLTEMKSATGRYEKDWHRLLVAAEEAKIELSTELSAEIEFELEDDNGDEVEGIVTITRSQFENIIKDRVFETSKMLKSMLTRQTIQPSDLKFVLMVGGSTFIPFVRQHIGEVMGIPVNTGIDPTNAIAIGAAFFAGTKQQRLESQEHRVSPKSNIRVRAVYERSSQEIEEFFSAKIEGDTSGMTYRIHSLDGSFDSNIKPLKARINEDLPLRKGEFNLFEFKIMDAQGDAIEHGYESIQIAQGRYSVAGQMLPDELSLVKDIIGSKETTLIRLFDKNAILPTRAKRTVDVGRTVIKGSDAQDNGVKIIVVEGPSNGNYLSNKPIGTLEITGEMISRDLLKGTEIDLTFELSESRDLTISAYLNGTGQDFSQTFNPKKRNVKPVELGQDILSLEMLIQDEQESAASHGSTDTSRNLKSLLNDTQDLLLEAGQLSDDSITDEKFQLEDKKRAIAAELHQLTQNKQIDAAKASYLQIKNDVSALVRENGNDQEKHALREVIGREEVFLRSSNAASIVMATEELSSIRYQILQRTPSYLVGCFEYLMEHSISLNDQVQAKHLFASGKNLIESESWEELNIVVSRLWQLMPEQEQQAEEAKMFTGIV